ncbi:nucleoside diphosphate-linked moiety X motif 19-like [Bradysia coprophila]|uniref:nucleoside diphosphate-linked moiety X motif 19-like n=1 Tax=Bradysia coprophila TaxID=38358 RepID=UPI00187DAF8C|nr:nucleoside diphosphate-linked moiety X motif 19-like [Bradysia coprophila]XP_037051314.1 nucleoside diphosphate-linked moiety X motif 19-like [Bradysia coprophila]
MSAKIEVVKKAWRESATLLVLGRNMLKNQQSTECNYKVLVMKRSKQSSFMPNGFVFPGGAVDKSDDSVDWVELYKSFGVTNERIKEISSVKGQRPFIFLKKEEHAIPREVSLRITAIREAFEELGLLLVKNRDQLRTNSSFSTHCRPVEIERWQNEVHNDASKFYELCKQLQVVPDITTCFEWAAWLTPSTFRGRFETAFFLCALDDQPELLMEKNEVQEFLWDSPRNLLKMFADNKIWLPPPQCYELLRLCHINDIDDVVSFAKSRNNKGITLHLPMYYEATDGSVFAYPGDDLYPTDPCYTHTVHDPSIYKEKSCEEIRALATKMHRYELMPSKGGFSFQMNIEPFNGHLSPIVPNLLG